MGMFKQVAIIGVGFIGGSLGLALKKRRIAKEVIGIARRTRTLTLAKSLGAIDAGFLNIEAIRQADLVILATPVNTIVELADRIAQSISKDCMITDVGSTKGEITAHLEKFFSNYVGTHPLAGSEKRGVSYAREDMFQDSLCLITPTKQTHPRVLQKVKALWIRLGAKVVFMSPREHDRILSYVSHLPHLVAYALISSLPRKFLVYAASGLKDTTRIAASDPVIWNDIFFSNRKDLLYAIRSYQAALDFLHTALKNNDKKALYRRLAQAQAIRESLV